MITLVHSAAGPLALIVAAAGCVHESNCGDTSLPQNTGVIVEAEREGMITGITTGNACAGANVFCLSQPSRRDFVAGCVRYHISGAHEGVCTLLVKTDVGEFAFSVELTRLVQCSDETVVYARDRNQATVRVPPPK